MEDSELYLKIRTFNYLRKIIAKGFYNEIVDEKSSSLRVGVILTINGKSIGIERGLGTELRDMEMKYS